MKNLLNFKAIIFLGLLFIITIISDGSDHPVLAATSIKIQSVDYYNENIIVRNGTNNKIYYADEVSASKNNWDVMTIDAGTYTTLDTSYMLPGVDNVVLVKGDVETGISRVTVKRKPSKLNVSINYAYIDDLASTDSMGSLINIMSSEGNGKNPISFEDLEWKKNATGNWAGTQSLTIDQLEKFLVRGTYLYFRIKAVNDVANGSYYPNGNKGRRFSDEVKLRIEKKSPPVVSGIDGTKMKADIKVGKEYRVTAVYANGTIAGSSGWNKVTNKADSPVNLETIANEISPRYVSGGKTIVFDGKTVAFPQLKIEVRSYATSKTAASKISETLLNPQRKLTNSIIIGVPDNDAIENGDDNVYLSYNGNQSIAIYIPTASSELLYEYCVVKKEDTFSFDRASWTQIAKGTAIKVLSSKAVDGGTLYVRKKEIKYKAATASKDAVAYALASTYVSTKINYPSSPIITKTNLSYVKGYTTPLKITVKLNSNGKTAFETEVKSIKLGTKELGFTTSTAPLAGDPTVFIMTITLNEDDVKNTTNGTNRALSITFMNGTVDKSSVLLSITSPIASASLSAIATKGTASGTTKITVSSSKDINNTWVYDIGSVPVTGKYTADTLPASVGKAFQTGEDIPVTAGEYITIYEISAGRNIIKYKSILITASQIL